MRTITLVLSLAMVFLIVTGSVAGAYYYLTAVLPQSASPTPVPSPTKSPTPNVSPTTSPTPFQSPSSSPTPTPTSTLSTTPSPTVTPTPTPTPSPAEWTITGIDESYTANNLYIKAGTFTQYKFFPANQVNIFVVVRFALAANVEAEPLDVKDILVVLDDVQEFHPVGWVESASTTYAGEFSGNISRGGSVFAIVTDMQEGTFSSNMTSTYSGGIPALKFVYLLPAEYLNGKHTLQQKIAGSAMGTAFSVEPPQMLQGHIAISSSGSYVAVTRLNKLYFFDTSNSSASWVYTHPNLLRPSIISSDGSYVLVVDAKMPNVTVLMFNKSSNQPLWTRSFIGLQAVTGFEYTMSADGRRVAVAAKEQVSSWGSFIYVMDASNGNIISKLGDYTTNWSPTANGAIFSVDFLKFSSDGEYLASLSWDGELFWFNSLNSTFIWKMHFMYPEYPSGTSFVAMDVSSDGKYITYTYENLNSTTVQIRKNNGDSLWNYTFASENGLNHYLIACRSLFSADGSSLLLLYGKNQPYEYANNLYVYNPYATNLTMFNAQTGSLIWTKTTNDFPSSAVSVDMSSDGNLIAVACNDGTVFLLNKAGNILGNRSGLGSQAAISRDGGFIVAASRTEVYLLNGATLATVWTYSFP